MLFANQLPVSLDYFLRKVWTFAALLSSEVPFSSSNFNNLLFLSSPLTRENSTKSCLHLPMLGKFWDGSLEALEHGGWGEPPSPGQMVKADRRWPRRSQSLETWGTGLCVIQNSIKTVGGRPHPCPLFPPTRYLQFSQHVSEYLYLSCSVVGGIAC